MAHTCTSCSSLELMKSAREFQLQGAGCLFTFQGSLRKAISNETEAQLQLLEAMLRTGI